jgi:hypothetical protein
MPGFFYTSLGRGSWGPFGMENDIHFNRRLTHRTVTLPDVVTDGVDLRDLADNDHREDFILGGRCVYT